MSKVDDFLLGRSPSFSLGADQEDRKDLNLTQLAAETGRVRGRVTNSATGSPIENATVKVRAQSGTPIAHTQTNPGGNYSIDGLPPGTYAINVALQGYLTSPAQVFTIQGNQTIDINVSLIPEPAVFNTIYGTITDLTTGDTIDGAEVVLIPEIGSAVNATVAVSNSDGEYLINKVPDSTQSLLVVKTGYYPSAFITVISSGGSKLNTDVSIIPYSLPQSTVNGFIKSQSGTPIANAFVGLYLINLQGEEILQQTTFTDANGFYIFGRATEGTYVVKAKSEKDAAV